jgi:hypothetical protein
MVNTMNQYSGLLNNPFAKPKSLTDEEFRQQMIETYTKPKDPGTMYFSPTFKDTEQTITTDFGARQIPSKKLTGLFQTGAEIEAEDKASKNREAAFEASGETIPSGEEVAKAGPIKEINEALAESKPKTMMSKLNSVADKIFNLQDNNPEAYDKIINGLDIYVRGQRGDTIAEAILGNNKFKKEQASALFQSAIAANNLKVSEMKVLQAQKKDIEVQSPSDDLKKLAGNILDKDFDIDNENDAFQLASRAKVKQRNNPALDEATALTLAIQDAVASGELVSGKGKLGSGKFKSKAGQSKSIQEVMKAFNMSQEEATQEIIDQGFIPR